MALTTLSVEGEDLAIFSKLKVAESAKAGRQLRNSEYFHIIIQKVSKVV